MASDDYLHPVRSHGIRNWPINDQAILYATPRGWHLSMLFGSAELTLVVSRDRARYLLFRLAGPDYPY